MTLLYAELREIAHRLRLAHRDAAPGTLSLVHEAYLRLAWVRARALLYDSLGT